MNKRISTYAFVDASNIIYGAKAEGWFIDQKKLLNYLKKKFIDFGSLRFLIEYKKMGRTLN